MLYQAEVFANRLKARYRHFFRRFKKNNIDVFRLYDRDIPEVRAVVDWYAGHLVIGEYIRTQTGPEWLPFMAKAAGEALNVPPEKIFMKHRKTKVETGTRYKGGVASKNRFVVNERDCQFWVNLDSFLDTGLFSDHRDTRALIRKEVKGHDFLNLFAYTGAFSVVAALGGAKSVTTVDRSATYIRWAEDNFELNHIKENNHKFIHSDVEKFLDTAAKQKNKFSYCFVDPPSFSNRTGTGTFDVNKHHPELLEKVFTVMAPNGIVYFSTNHQRFDFKLNRLKVKNIKEITPKTIPEDYRNKLVHRCWRIEL